MVLLTMLFLISILIFGACAIYFAVKEEKAQKLLLEREEKQKQRIYEVSILREIQERIGYELDIEKVADVITGSLRNLFAYSTTSSILIKQNKIIFKTYAEERVSHNFVEQVKKTTMASLAALSEKPLPSAIDDVTAGIMLDDSVDLPVGSFFNIPLIIENEVQGIINISSLEPGLYKESQMTILYQITNLASTAITRLHQVLTTEKGKLTAMIASLADGVFMVNKKKQLQIINQTARTLLHIEKDDPTMLDVAQALGNQLDLSSMLEEVLKTEQSITAKEITIHDKNMQLFITPVKDNTQGGLIGASVLLHDITLEKNLDVMKDDFTNMMVHELRAPLTAIRGAASLIRTEKAKLNEEEIEKLLTITTDQSTKLLNLVGGILDAAKLEAGKFALQKSITDIKKAVEQSVALFTTQAHTKHITLTLSADDSIPPFLLDPMRFGEVMNNLLSNALKYTPEHGTVSVQLKQKHSESGEQVVLTVADNGIGIAKERQSQLFSKFYQVQHEKSDLRYITKGTGLGLYIVKGIVEAHGGDVTVESEPNHGTTFSFTLPITLPAQDQKTPPPSQIFNTTVN